MGKRKVLFLAVGMMIITLYYLLRLFGHTSTMEFISSLFLLGFLTKIAERNIRFQLYEDKLTLPAMGLGILINILIASGLQESILQRALLSLVGLLLAGGCLYILETIAEHITKKEWIGGGDIKLTAAMGAFIGPYVMWIFPIWVFVFIIFASIYKITGLLKKTKTASAMPSVLIHFVSLISLLSIQHNILDLPIIILGFLILLIGSCCLFDQRGIGYEGDKLKDFKR